MTEPIEDLESRVAYLEECVERLQLRDNALTEGLRQVRDVVLPRTKTDYPRAMQSLRDALDAAPPTPEEERVYQSMMKSLSRNHDVPTCKCERPEPTNNPSVMDIVASFLKTFGYDGLYNDDCGCTLDNLAPCGEMNHQDCRVGYWKACGNCLGPVKGESCDECE